MKLLAPYRSAIYSIAILVLFSLAAVARPTSQSNVTPPRELSSARFLQPVFRLASKLLEAVWTASPPLDVSKSGLTLANTPYDEQVVLRFNVASGLEAAKLASLSNSLSFDVWESNEDWVDVRIPSASVPELLEHLPASLQNFKPVLDGPALLHAIAASYPSYSDSDSEVEVKAAFTPRISKVNSSSTNVFFQEYRPLSVLVPWMQLMQSMFPSHVTLITIGKSYEGREIHALRVGVHPNMSEKNQEPRKTIVISGGMHAREWVGISTVNYLAYSFITGYGKYLDITALVQDFDWVFIPTLNPDGYAYTWSDDRLWRKTRQSTRFLFCPGIDLDRTFSYQWTGQAGNPCSENYAGQGSFEAVEARALANWTRNETAMNNVEFVGFIDLHSYSQQILYPYSYSCVDEPPTLEDLEELGQGLAKAIRLGGEFYKVTSACGASVLSETGTGGSALDWFYQELGIRHAFQIKLRDNGAYGFLLPKEYIIPTGQEILNAARHFGSSMQALFIAEKGDEGAAESSSQIAESFLSSDTQKPLE